MKVIFLQDVARIGHQYEIKVVKDGFARNYLLPRRLALPATPENQTRLKSLSMAKTDSLAKQTALAEKAFTVLSDLILKIQMKANDQGHLFASLHETDIKNFLAKEGIVIATDWLKLPKPIKTIGRHEIEIKYGARAAHFTLAVEALKA